MKMNKNNITIEIDSTNVWRPLTMNVELISTFYNNLITRKEGCL